MIDIKNIIDKYTSERFKKNPAFIKNFIYWLVEKTIHLNRINDFLEKNSDKFGIEFIDELFEYLDFSFVIAQKDMDKIPSEGRLLIIANHPLGALDGLALIKAISIIRPDIRIIANEILSSVSNLKELILPFNVYSSSTQKENIKAIERSLDNEEAVILFPAAEVSRIKMGNLKDAVWNKGILYFAKKSNAPILPVYINARNSLFFYFISWIHKRVSTILLPREIFNKQSKNISMVIGEQIPARVFTSLLIDQKIQLRLLKKHLYLIGKNKKGIFATERNIIHPVSRKALKKELQLSILFGNTTDGKKILLTDFQKTPEIVKEIARLREITFRRVGEGSGKKLDIDEFDKYYKHLVIWDEDELEIVGAYRIGICEDIIKNFGPEGLYTSTLFNYSKKFISDYLGSALELGRSFVQRKYWNSLALDYLWQGIGAFIAFDNKIKYLIGPVSISNVYPVSAKEILVYFYKKWYGNDGRLVISKNSFFTSQKNLEEYANIFNGLNPKEDYRKLKSIIKHFGFSIPPLYKHYSDLCEPGGVKFLDFNIDPDFNNCIDGFITVEIDKIKESKKQRYIKSNISDTKDSLVPFSNVI